MCVCVVGGFCVWSFICDVVLNVLMSEPVLYLHLPLPFSLYLDPNCEPSRLFSGKVNFKTISRRKNKMQRV